jgi:predicted phage-related endonuclease
VLQHPDPDKHFMLANLDYAVVGCDEVQILECKSVGEWGTKLWRDGVPLYVIIQVQHQLAVTGKQAAHICALICGHEAKIFKVERNEIVIDQIMTSERIFWSCVENDIPPSVDASESAAKALQLLYPQHIPLQTVDFSTWRVLINCLQICCMRKNNSPTIKPSMTISSIGFRHS